MKKIILYSIAFSLSNALSSLDQAVKQNQEFVEKNKELVSKLVESIDTTNKKAAEVSIKDNDYLTKYETLENQKVSIDKVIQQFKQRESELETNIIGMTKNKVLREGEIAKNIAQANTIEAQKKVLEDTLKAETEKLESMQKQVQQQLDALQIPIPSKV